MEKPTPKEVTDYAKSRGFDLDGELFCDFYASKGWLVGKSPMKDWQAAVRTWQRQRKDQGRCYGMSYIKPQYLRPVPKLHKPTPKPEIAERPTAKYLDKSIPELKALLGQANAFEGVLINLAIRMKQRSANG